MTFVVILNKGTTGVCKDIFLLKIIPTLLQASNSIPEILIQVFSGNTQPQSSQLAEPFMD